MIRSFTIVENRDGKGNVEYSVSGDLPIEEVARALVIIALRTNLSEPKKEEKAISDSSEPHNK
jgi:hypothetical protein